MALNATSRSSARRASTGRTAGRTGANARPADGTRPRDGEVLKAAAEVFARRGYAASTVQDIADALGILKGSVYYYIDTKEDLLYRLLLQVHEEVDEILEQTKARDGQDPLQQIADYLRGQTTFNLKNLIRISVYYRDIDQLSEPRRREILQRRHTHERYILELIEAAQNTNSIDPTRDAHLLTNHVFATMIWPYQWYRPRGRKKLDEVVDSVVEFAIHGLTN